MRQHSIATIFAGWLISATSIAAAFLPGCAAATSNLEERAQALERQIICPVCPGETLDQSQVQIAKDMRALIQERLADGQSNAEIKQFFVARYGQRILASPPSAGIGLLAWLVPPAAILAGAAALFLVVRRMSGTGNRSQDVADDTYLERVDRELSEQLKAKSNPASMHGDG